MSGSNSSNPAEQAVAEPIQLAVHSMPRLDAVQPRAGRGRGKLLLILLACAAPVIASYFTYFVVRPEARSNYGELIDPPRALPQQWRPTRADTPPGRSGHCAADQ